MQYLQDLLTAGSSLVLSPIDIADSIMLDARKNDAGETDRNAGGNSTCTPTTAKEAGVSLRDVRIW